MSFILGLRIRVFGDSLALCFFMCKSLLPSCICCHSPFLQSWVCTFSWLLTKESLSLQVAEYWFDVEKSIIAGFRVVLGKN